jgi:hypothetical protein
MLLLARAEARKDLMIAVFKLTRATGIPGADNPIVKGILLQFNRILDTNLLDLADDQVQKVRDTLIECMHDLLEMERCYDSYISIEEEAVKAITRAGRTIVHGRTLQFDDPTDELKRRFKAFLMQSFMVIRRIIKIANILLGEKLKKPKALKVYLITKFPDNHPYRQMIETDSEWIVALSNLRGAVEHPEDNPELQITQFDVVGFDGDKPVCRLPILNCTPSSGHSVSSII